MGSAKLAFPFLSLAVLLVVVPLRIQAADDIFKFLTPLWRNGLPSSSRTRIFDHSPETSSGSSRAYGRVVPACNLDLKTGNFCLLEERKSGGKLETATAEGRCLSGFPEGVSKLVLAAAEAVAFVRSMQFAVQYCVNENDKHFERNYNSFESKLIVYESEGNKQQAMDEWYKTLYDLSREMRNVQEDIDTKTAEIEELRNKAVKYSRDVDRLDQLSVYVSEERTMLEQALLERRGDFEAAEKELMKALKPISGDVPKDRLEDEGRNAIMRLAGATEQKANLQTLRKALEKYAERAGEVEVVDEALKSVSAELAGLGSARQKALSDSEDNSRALKATEESRRKDVTKQINLSLTGFEFHNGGPLLPMLEEDRKGLHGKWRVVAEELRRQMEILQSPEPPKDVKDKLREVAYGVFGSRMRGLHRELGTILFDAVSSYMIIEGKDDAARKSQA